MLRRLNKTGYSEGVGHNELKSGKETITPTFISTGLNNVLWFLSVDREISV